MRDNGEGQVRWSVYLNTRGHGCALLVAFCSAGSSCWKATTMKLVPLLQSQELADLQARDHILVKNTSAMPHELHQALANALPTCEDIEERGKMSRMPKGSCCCMSASLACRPNCYTLCRCNEQRLAPVTLQRTLCSFKHRHHRLDKDTVRQSRSTMHCCNMGTLSRCSCMNRTVATHR